MAVTAAMVKELRERTGAGMMECKKALVETDGDLEAAVEQLRKSGQAKADKKAGRVAADGKIVIATGDDVVALVEVNSETDFVAKDENFSAFADKVAALVLAGRPAGLDELMAAELGGQSVEEARKALIAKVGENIGVRRFEVVPADGNTGVYSHGARIGSVVVLDGGDAELARDLAMHVAASNPACISEEDVDPEQLASERRILTEQARDSGKPAEIIEKMVEGRLRKWLSEITLVGQPFVKDPDVTVGKLLDKAGATVKRFVRYEVGEGIEKKEENFAEEVMAQIQGS
ncbi:translation elongation factor Ts [Lentisalinibacter sediminis]|uniref:translation elongation factor Ts n=1 Tax=Lentisalinibacter sediminis TaxID=2992237 RepID=UPI00386AB666